MPSPSLTLLRTQSDDRLVALAREGHARAFEAIVERYRRSLLRSARRVLPEGRAEDALQQALLNAWTALQRGDDVRELRPWLYRIVHRTALNALRMSGYDYEELHEALRIADAGDDELERRAVVRQTLASLAALPERQREALLRTAVSGDPQEEVARDLGLSDNALRQLIHRARVSVRAAATALTPLPVVTAAAAGTPRGDSLVDRIAELAAGAAGGGASVTLAKAGTVAVVASTALSGPALVDRVADRPPRTPVAAASATPAPERPRAKTLEPAHLTPVASTRPAKAAAPPGSPPRAVHRPERDVDEIERDERRRGDGEDQSERSGREPTGGERGDEDHSGTGSPGPSEQQAPASNGPGSGEAVELHEESERSGPSPTPEPAPLASPSPSPEPDGDLDEPDHD
jgi:RNA polymerase sigma factor (sigma-70 family)